MSTAPESVPPSPFHEVRRSHAADLVFDQLAAAILGGTLAPDAPLPPERVLAERFGVSRIIARQAVHRLAEVGLVRVKQGGATLVRDPTKVRDLRVIELYYRLGPYTRKDVRDINEKQLLQGHCLLQIASQRASSTQLASLGRIVDEYVEGGADAAALRAFERRFWTAVAEVGGNRLYIFETNWWFRLLDEQPRAHHEVFGPPAARAMFLKELARRLVAREDAPAFYLQIVLPVLTSFASTKGGHSQPPPAPPAIATQPSKGARRKS